MKTAKARGRISGGMLLLQLAGLIVPFVLLHPMITSDFLSNAAPNSFQIKLAVLLLLINCGLTIAISVVAFPVLLKDSPAIAVLLVTVSAIMLVFQAVDNAHLMSMVSLSEQYAQARGSNEVFQTLSAVVRQDRVWVHYSELLAIDSWICIFYSVLYYFHLVPRELAVFGLATVVLHFAAIPLPFFLGYPGMTMLGMPMAFSHVALAIWLLAKGFNEAEAMKLTRRSPAIA